MNSNRKPFYYLAILLTIAVIVVWAQSATQPIQYNHKIHIEDAGLACIDCHVNVETQARASIPNIEICADCHDETGTENVEADKVAQFVIDGKHIPWVRIHAVADYAYFSHRRHVALGQLECVECHGNVATREKPFTESFVEIKMAWCIDCHEQRAVTTDCYACHR